LDRAFDRLLSTISVAHAERSYAKQASAELLDLYWRKRRENPQMGARALYEAVVAQRLGAQASRTREIMRRVEESFTDWPVERELRFRHVVHYLIFDEYMRTGNARGGTRTNMAAAVASIIAEEL